MGGAGDAATMLPTQPVPDRWEPVTRIGRRSDMRATLQELWSAADEAAGRDLETEGWGCDGCGGAVGRGDADPERRALLRANPRVDLEPAERSRPDRHRH